MPTDAQIEAVVYVLSDQFGLDCSFFIPDQKTGRNTAQEISGIIIAAYEATRPAVTTDETFDTLISEAKGKFVYVQGRTGPEWSSSLVDYLRAVRERLARALIPEIPERLASIVVTPASDGLWAQVNVRTSHSVRSTTGTGPTIPAAIANALKEADHA